MTRVLALMALLALVLTGCSHGSPDSAGEPGDIAITRSQIIVFEDAGAWLLSMDIHSSANDQITGVSVRGKALALHSAIQIDGAGQDATPTPGGEPLPSIALPADQVVTLGDDGYGAVGDIPETTPVDGDLLDVEVLLEVHGPITLSIPVVVQ